MAGNTELTVEEQQKNEIEELRNVKKEIQKRQNGIKATVGSSLFGGTVGLITVDALIAPTASGAALLLVGLAGTYTGMGAFAAIGYGIYTATHRKPKETSEKKEAEKEEDDDDSAATIHSGPPALIQNIAPGRV